MNLPSPAVSSSVRVKLPAGRYIDSMTVVESFPSKCPGLLSNITSSPQDSLKPVSAAAESRRMLISTRWRGPSVGVGLDEISSGGTSSDGAASVNVPILK